HALDLGDAADAADAISASTIRATEPALRTGFLLLVACAYVGDAVDAVDACHCATIRATEAPLGTRILFSAACTRSRRRGRRQSPRRLFAPQNQHLELGFLLRALDLCDATDATDADFRVDRWRHSSGTWNSGFYSCVRWTSATRQTRQTPTTASTIGATELSLELGISLSISATRQTRQTPISASTIRATEPALRIGFLLFVRWMSGTRWTQLTRCHASTIRATEAPLELGFYSRQHALDLGDAADANLRVDYSRHRTSLELGFFYCVRWMSGTRWTQLRLSLRRPFAPQKRHLELGFLFSADLGDAADAKLRSTIRATEPALRTRVFIIGSVHWTCDATDDRRHFRVDRWRHSSGTWNSVLFLVACAGCRDAWTQDACTASTIRATEAHLNSDFYSNLDLGDAADAADANLRVDYSRHSSATWKIGFSSSTAPRSSLRPSADIHRAHSVRWTSATRQTRQTPTTASTIGATEGHLELGISLSHALDLGDAADAADVNLRVDHSRHRTT
ncbi:hypothetical protein BKA62DRAFT_820515, partial [Auriculariales sp. MPI-PUGE-AT-0066]